MKVHFSKSTWYHSFPFTIFRVDVSIRVLENWNSQNVITIAGPALGSALYSLGGFSLLFYVLGSTILLLTVIPFYLLGKVRTEENDNSSESTREDVSAKRTWLDCFEIRLSIPFTVQLSRSCQLWDQNSSSLSWELECQVCCIYLFRCQSWIFQQKNSFWKRVFFRWSIEKKYSLLHFAIFFM